MASDTTASQTAQGTLNRDLAGNITAVFIIEGGGYTYSATMAPSVKPFASNNVTLTYASIDDLTGHATYSGRVGINDVSFTFGNKNTITGPLNPPGVQPAVQVSGNGSWIVGSHPLSMRFSISTLKSSVLLSVPTEE